MPAVTAKLAGGGRLAARRTLSLAIAAKLTAGGGVTVGVPEQGGGGVVISPAIVFPGKPPNPLGVKVELNLNGAWTDITNYVMLRDTLQITNMGRMDESSSISASQLMLTLNNRDSRFTPQNPGSPYYPYIARNTQIRLSVHATSAAGVTYSGYRYSGEVSSWPPQQNTSGRDNYVQITASGIWRRISQNQANLGSAFTRYLRKLSGVAAAWAMEDGSGKAFVLTAGSGGNGTFTGTPSFQSDSTSFPGSDALPALNGARMTFTVSGGSVTNNITRFALSVQPSGDSTAGASAWNISETDSSGTVAKFESYLHTDGTLGFQGLNSGGGVLFSTNTNTNVHGVPVVVSLELTPGVNWAVKIIKPGSGAVLESHSGTIGGSIGAVSAVKINRAGALSDTVVGQLGVYYGAPDLVTAAKAMGGWTGEYAVDRFVRLCTEEQIAPTTIGVTSAQMGPQRDGTFATLLQEIEDTDGGLLFEPRDTFGLAYRTLASLMNQSPAVTLDYLGGQLGATLAPVYDDQLLKNQWTVTNTDGYVALATLTIGATSIQPPPAGVGLYAGTANTNAYLDAQTNAIAQHRLFLGTVDDVRYPEITVNLARPQAATVFAAAAGLRIGDYLRVVNVPSTIDTTAVNQLGWGHHETLSHNEWTIIYNCVPEAPFESGFSPGTYSVVQGTSAAPVGSTSGASIAAGAVGLPALSTSITARGIGGSTSFVSSAIPYDWTFDVYDTPTDATYFICTTEQAQPIVAGDTFTNSLGYGGPFTVTSVSVDSANPGYADVHFTPDASSAMTSGTVFGGKEGDIWINSAADNQVEQWHNGTWTVYQFGPQAVSFSAGGVQVTIGPTQPTSPNVNDIWYDSTNGYQMKQWNGASWVPYQFGTTAIAPDSITTALIAAGAVTATEIAATTITGGNIAGATITGDKIAGTTITAANITAGTITAGLLASDIVKAGIVDGTEIDGSVFRATNGSGATITTINQSDGALLQYIDNHSATQGWLANSMAHEAGTDEFGYVYTKGITSYYYDGSRYWAYALNQGKLYIYYASTTGGPWVGTDANAYDLGFVMAGNANNLLLSSTWQTVETVPVGARGVYHCTGWLNITQGGTAGGNLQIGFGPGTGGATIILNCDGNSVFHQAGANPSAIGALFVPHGGSVPNFTYSPLGANLGYIYSWDLTIGFDVDGTPLELNAYSSGTGTRAASCAIRLEKYA